MEKCNHCNKLLPKSKEILYYGPCPKGVSRTWTIRSHPCFVCGKRCHTMGSELNGWCHKKCFQELRDRFLQQCGTGFLKDIDSVSKHYREKHNYLYRYGFDGLVAHWITHQRKKCNCDLEKVFAKWNKETK